MLSRQVLSAWAKYRRDSDESLSLVRHCEDAAEVAGYLWDCWLPESTRRLLAGPLQPGDARTLARFLAGTHDVGKLSPAFAVQVDPLRAPMERASLAFPAGCGGSSRPPHSVVTFHALYEYLEHQLGFAFKVARSFAIVGGSHHGMPPDRQQANPNSVADMYYGGSEWGEARRQLIDHIIDVTDARETLTRAGQERLTNPQQVLWTAFVIMADWIASSDLFPLTDRYDSVEPAAQAWAALRLPGPWRPPQPTDLDELLATRFGLPPGATPNPMQRRVFAAAQQMDEPGLIIVEATMGTGKTEAAFAAAEHLAAKFGLGGIFVALPTMATSNAMFTRTHSWLAHQSGLLASVSLAHGKSHLNDEFLSLRSSLVDIENDENASTRKTTRAQIIAHQWFFGRKRAMLADFVVGTIDQVLFAGLMTKHVMLRHLALANKVVIIDEVHAADAYMRQYLIRVLEWLAAYHVPVIMLSATLPGDQRKAFVEAYERGRTWSDDLPIVGEIGYPVVTTVSRRRTVHPVAADISHTVTLDRLDDDGNLTALLDDALSGGGCVAVIRNTVGRAQDTARRLRETFGQDVTLLHSRFVAAHRSQLEARLIHELGRGGQRPTRRIVVATQVIEQSLDVDFDLIVSDLAPMDLLLQRAGRLHRHRRSNRGRMTSPRLIVTGVDDWDARPPEPVRGSVSVYGRSKLLRAAAVLEGVSELEVPQDIPRFVQAAYDDALVLPRGWEDAMTGADSAEAASIADQRTRASSWRLRCPNSGEYIAGWIATDVGDVDDSRGYAKVRDSREAVEVLVTKRVGDVVYLLPQCGNDPIETDYAPSNGHLIRKILGSTLRLPEPLCRTSARTDATIAELEQRMYQGWQESHWLAGELVLELDHNQCASLGGLLLRYDDTEGLTYRDEVESDD